MKIKIATKYSAEKYQKGIKQPREAQSLINKQIQAVGESVDTQNNLAMKAIKGRLKIFPEVAAHLGGIFIWLYQSR